jgi:Dolichyl-phosphate-mannose-protein mannosyltransferase
MALLNTIGWLAAVFLLGLISISFGARILRLAGIKVSGTLERALLSAGVSFAILQLAVFALLAEGWLRRGTLGILFLAMTISAGAEWKIVAELSRATREFLSDAAKSQLRTALVFAIAVVLVLEAVMAMAPLTGSDALHYHFTTVSLWLHNGLTPLYGIVSSFGTGQAHMLIALGLALGSDHISVGLIFLGGIFSVAALYVLAHNWMSFERSLIATLVFLLSPIAFWQMTIAGSPDIWMMFYTMLAVLAAARGITLRSARWAALAGFLAGAAGGSKYPAWIIPITLGLVFLVECRSFWLATASSFAAFVAGLAPLIRNAMWTGNPFFPYASNVFLPQKMNAYTLQATLTDTHNSWAHPGILGWMEYPFRMVLDGQSYGVGHYFGPIVLAFAPLLLISYRPGPLFRVAAWIWAAMFLSNMATSQMGRFLLPVFGIALAITLAGVETASRIGRPFVRLACNGAVAIFLMLGTAAFVAYGKDFFPVSVGLESREHFLEREAPNYQEASFANSFLDGKHDATLVFFQHLYYLRINFVVGDPASNWELYSDQYATPNAMLEWLRKYDVRWIVKPPEYPDPVDGALQQLESTGILRPVASTVVETFSGWRIEGTKVQEGMRILEVRPAQP